MKDDREKPDKGGIVMLENEKKVTELKEDELKDVAGGFVPPHKGNPTFHECPCCEYAFPSPLGAYDRCPSCGRECGDTRHWTEEFTRSYRG